MSDLNNTLGAITLYKSADEQTFQDALREYYSRGLRATALQKALGIGVAGLGVGLGARGLLGLLGLGRHNVSPEDPYSSSVIDIEEEEEKEAAFRHFLKKAGGLYPGIPAINGGERSTPQQVAPKALGRMANGMLPGGTIDENGVYWQPKPKLKPIPSGSFHEMIERKLKDLQKRVEEEELRKGIREGKVASTKEAGLLDFIKGRYAESTRGVPWAIPAAVGAGAGGLYGGWKMMDYILDQRRESRIDEELEEAKAEYEAALADIKEAADGSFSKDLDELYNNLNTYGEKAAASWPEIGGQAAGVYGTAAGLGALLMAIMGYKQGRKKQRRRVIEKAQTSRRREEYRRRPDPLFVRSNRRTLTVGPTTADESSDAAPSLDEIEDQLI